MRTIWRGKDHDLTAGFDEPGGGWVMVLTVAITAMGAILITSALSDFTFGRWLAVTLGLMLTQVRVIPNRPDPDPMGESLKKWTGGE